MTLWQRYSTKSLITAEADMGMAVKPDLNIAGSKWEEHFSVSLTALDPVSVLSQHWSKVPKIRVCDTKMQGDYVKNRQTGFWINFVRVGGIRQ